MKITIIAPWVYRILDFLSPENFNYFSQLHHKSDFMYQFSENSHKCYISKIYKDMKSVYYSDFKILEKLVSKLYWKSLELNDGMLLFKMDKDCFIWEHTDEHSSIQSTLHLIPGNNVGWELIISWKIIKPLENSIIFFPWFMKHSVTHITECFEERRTISLWFHENV